MKPWGGVLTPYTKSHASGPKASGTELYSSQERAGVSLCDLGVGEAFFHMTLKA